MIRSKRPLLLLALAGLLLGGSLVEVLAASAETTGYRRAKRWGHSEAQARCYSGVFANYASLSRYGRWTTGGRRRGDLFRHEAYARCGVLR